MSGRQGSFGNAFQQATVWSLPAQKTEMRKLERRVVQTELERSAADTDPVTLSQRFGSASNVSIHLQYLVLDRVYRRTEDEPIFEQARAPAAMSSRACSTRSSRG